jgi:hypothetical protein
MNPKIVKLLNKGLSIHTLERLSEEQLNVLYARVLNEQAPPNEVKKVTSTQTTVPPNGSANVPTGAKVENKGGKTIITTTETELGEEEKEIEEKSVSKQQQKLMGLALSVKRGDTAKTKVSKKVKDMSKSMSKKDLEDFASTKHKGLPKKKETKENEDVKNLEESIMRLVEKHLYPEVTKKDLLNIVNKR